MRSGAGLAVAAVAALALVSGWPRRPAGSRVLAVRPAHRVTKPSFSELAELVYHGYPLDEILNVFPDHSSLLLGGKRLVVVTDMGNMVVSLSPKGEPQVYRSAR
jgi:hypothetical protein